MRGLSVRLLFAACFVAAQSSGGAAMAAEAEPAVHHEAGLRLDPDSRQIEVRDTIARRLGGVPEFTLAPWMKVVEARVNGAPVQAERAGERVRLPVSDGNGSRQTIELRLRGRVPPLPPVLERRGLAGAMAGPEGSVLPAYAGWLPRFETQRVRFRLEVEVPASYRAVSVGRLVDEASGPETYRATFETERTGELPTVFVGPYSVEEKTAGGVRLRTYFHPEVASFAAEYLESAADYIAHFSERIGPYPYSDFHVVSAPLPVGLGFTNSTYISRRIVPRPFMRGRSLAHEVLHNWFGNGIAIDYARGNWSEGLTTYLADYALAEQQAPSAAEQMRLGWLRALTALPRDRNVPVTSFVARSHDASQAIGYGKVAFVFHMLSQELGNEVFDAGLKELWAAQRFRVAAWPDLQAAFETAAGRDLSAFFDQWLSLAVLPRLELGQVEHRQNGQANELVMTIRQSAPPSRLRVPLAVETTAGIDRHWVELNSVEQIIVLPLPATPRSVAVDPAFDVLRQLLPGESAPIVRDVTLARDAVVVLLSSDGAFKSVSDRLASRLLQREFQASMPGSSEIAGVPAVVIGTTEDVARYRAEHSPDKNAETLQGRGTARVWTEREPGHPPRLFIAADDADALGALLRPLPHYRNQGFLVFEGSRAIARGVWPPPASPLSYRLAR